MEYTDLVSRQKSHVNGVLSKFMDNFIRNNLIWTPEQMYCALYEEIDKQHKQGWYGCKERVNGEWIFPYYKGNLWITSNDAKAFILKKFTDKYIKNNGLARRKSPLIERSRFGLKWDDNKFYDINFGLKNGYNFEKTAIVEELAIIPWSIKHVENELNTKYNSSIKNVLMQLSQSPIEIAFYNEWFRRYYYNENNPAIIPEFCGTRNMYYCFKDISGNYSFEQTPYCTSVNVRFDFAVVNYDKQKMLLIELDGDDYHKTKDQRINDSIKRTIATNNGWQLNVITGTQIYQNIEMVFNVMNDYFTIN